MTRGRLLLIGLVVLLTILFVAGIGIGLGQPSAGPLSPDWTKSLDGFLSTRAGPGDLSAEGASCLSAGYLTVARNTSCRYDLRSGFLGRKLRLKVDSVGPLGAVALSLSQPDLVTDTSTLTIPQQEVELRYQKQGSKLDVGCTGATPCRLHVDTG